DDDDEDTGVVVGVIEPIMFSTLSLDNTSIFSNSICITNINILQYFSQHISLIQIKGKFLYKLTHVHKLENFEGWMFLCNIASDLVHSDLRSLKFFLHLLLYIELLLGGTYSCLLGKIGDRNLENL
ncbi:hypothetical protein ACJX0J_039886, partial [Zea mays]